MEFTGWYLINNRRITFKVDYPSVNHFKRFLSDFDLKEGQYYYECQEKHYIPKTDRIYKKRKKK